MIKLSQKKVLLLHRLLIRETGGTSGVRDIGLLNSALESAYAAFDGKEFYPSGEEKAARIGFFLISNHAFVEGNKRIGMYVMLIFLEVSGIRVNCSNDDIVYVGMSAASGNMGYDGLLEWTKDRNMDLAQ